MAPAAAKQVRDPEIVSPLTIIEEYARTDDLIQRSEEFLDAAGRVIETWGTAHEARIKTLVTRPTAVTDVASFATMTEWLKNAAETDAATVACFEPRKSLGYKLHRLICNRESRVLAPLTAWMTTAKTNWDAFRRQAEQARRDEERRLEEVARKDQQDRLAAEAALLESRNEPALAQQVLEAAIHTPAPVVRLPSRLPETKGVTAKANWKWRPLGGDTPDCRKRAEKLVPRAFLTLNDKALTAHAKAHGSSVPVPGIEFYDAGSVAVRS